MLCLDEQFLLFEDARWKKNRRKKKFRSAARNSEKATFRAPHFQSSARRIDIHFVSLIFFDPPDGPLRKKGFARSLYYGVRVRVLKLYDALPSFKKQENAPRVRENMYFIFLRV